MMIRCTEPKQSHKALTELWPKIKDSLRAGRPVVVQVAEPRNDAQNALLHTLLTQISQRVTWAGQKRGHETWKRLLTAAWLRARGEKIEALPALDGQGVDVVFWRTSQLTRSECAELIDYVQAWAAEYAVEVTP